MTADPDQLIQKGEVMLQCKLFEVSNGGKLLIKAKNDVKTYFEKLNREIQQVEHCFMQNVERDICSQQEEVKQSVDQLTKSLQYIKQLKAEGRVDPSANESCRQILQSLEQAKVYGVQFVGLLDLSSVPQDAIGHIIRLQHRLNSFPQSLSVATGPTVTPYLEQPVVPAATKSHSPLPFSSAIEDPLQEAKHDDSSAMEFRAVLKTPSEDELHQMSIGGTFKLEISHPHRVIDDNALDISVRRQMSDGRQPYAAWSVVHSEEPKRLYLCFRIVQGVPHCVKVMEKGQDLIGSPLTVDFSFLGLNLPGSVAPVKSPPLTWPSPTRAVTELIPVEKLTLETKIKEEPMEAPVCEPVTVSAALPEKLIGVERLILRGFEYPLGVFITDLGTYFVCDGRKNVVLEFDKMGSTTSHIDNSEPSLFRLYHPSACVFFSLPRSRQEHLWVKDDYSVLHFVRPAGQHSGSVPWTFAGKLLPPSVVLHGNDKLYSLSLGFMAERQKYILLTLNPSLKVVYRFTIDEEEKFDMESVAFGPLLHMPPERFMASKCRFLHFHSSQVILCSDLGLRAVYVTDVHGVSLRNLGTNWALPAGISELPDGRVLVADCNRSAIQMYKVDGTFLYTLDIGKNAGRHSGIMYNGHVNKLGVLNLNEKSACILALKPA